MTAASSVLLVIEPGPSAPFAGVTLQSINRGPAASATDRLFDTAAPAQPWKSIVIHDSGSLTGDARQLDRLHEQVGRGGLGYHFVINNARGEGDIEAGFRWQHQFAGAYVEGENAAWFNRNAVGICLIGDAEQQRFTRTQLRELVWLVQELQREHQIPREAVFVDVGSFDNPGSAHFPEAWFRQQLRDITP